MSIVSKAVDALTRLPKKVDSMVFGGNVQKLIGDLFQAGGSAFNAFKHPIESALNAFKTSAPPPKAA